MNTFRDYFSNLTAPERVALADACGSSVGYLKLVAAGHKNASPELALAIERAASGAVRAEGICPDVKPGLWAYVHERAANLPHPDYRPALAPATSELKAA